MALARVLPPKKPDIFSLFLFFKDGFSLFLQPLLGQKHIPP